MKVKIRYDNSAHVGDGCRQQLCIKIAYNPLQIKIWLLQTAYRNLSLLYLTLLLPTT